MDKPGKNIFIYIFLILALALLFMPFVMAFNDILTRFVMKMDFYRFIQKVIVPWEIRMVGVILYPTGLKPLVMGEYLAINGKDAPFLIEVAWNCIGWQSLMFFIITAFVGLQGDKYSNLSKFKALLIGLVGTFLINLFRIAFVTIIAFYFGQSTAIIFHDYGTTLVIIVWLMFFWWFVYSFVLEERQSVVEKGVIKV